MIRMIATTISSSISEKPFCFRISNFPLVKFCFFEVSANIAAVLMFASASPKPLVTFVLSTFWRRALFSVVGQTSVALAHARTGKLWQNPSRKLTIRVNPGLRLS
jgi:hypothetical protein